MISTILRINWLNLKRDRVALGLTFVLPIVFFSIFATIFGATGDAAADAQIKVVIVDQDQTEISRRFADALDRQTALDVSATTDLEAGRKQVRDGDIPVAVTIPNGFGAVFGNFGASAASVDLIYDAANPIAQNAVAGLIQAAAFATAPDVLMEKGFQSLEQFGGGLTPQQNEAIEEFRPVLRGDQPGSAPSMIGIVRVQATDVRAGEAGTDDSQPLSMVAYYAAGIGVMFLLFSMAGAGGALLDEKESGTLERLLSSGAGMGTLLLGKWLFLAVTGVLQIGLMFLWAAVVFGLEFTPQRIFGALAMTAVTAAAAAGFGLVLASICRTRAQLSGISTIVILIMSALGGSMVPRFIMPKFMETTAMFTFNGWALDGFLKVFWYDDPASTTLQMLAALVPQLVVLAVLAGTFLSVARYFARRWEQA